MKICSMCNEEKSLSEFNFNTPFKFLYISSVVQYKHQSNVVEVIAKMRNNKFPVSLTMVGEIGDKKTGELLTKKISFVDPNGEFITWEKNIGLNYIAEFYHSTDAFVFASSCENMPNILIEAMASGLPIACSNFNPMPEFIENACIYFNPTRINEIEQALLELITNKDLRSNISQKSFECSKKYNWNLCADKTFDFLSTFL